MATRTFVIQVAKAVQVSLMPYKAVVGTLRRCVMCSLQGIPQLQASSQAYVAPVFDAGSRNAPSCLPISGLVDSE